MRKLTLQIEPLKNSQEIPFDLLELADPSVLQINTYLDAGTCYVATWDSEIMGVMVLNSINSSTIEIKNIAVKESSQGKGFGKKLVRYAAKICQESGYEFLLIGTGNSSIGQLALYQKEGFDMKRIEKDFFLDNYKEPIYENGIQCKHRIILEKNVKN